MEDFDITNLDDMSLESTPSDDPSQNMTSLEKLLAGTVPERPPVVVFGPDSNCTLEICKIEWSVYKYRPSLPANVIFLVIFAFAMGLHTYLGIRWKSLWFMAFMIVGCLSEIIGYAARIKMYENPFNFPAFMMQIVFVTGAPVYFTAAIYITLSKTIEHFSVELSRIKPKLFYWFFIPADMICLVLQATGGALSTVSSGTSQMGIDIAMVGLALQVAVIGIFMILYGDYLYRYFRSDRTRPLILREKLFFGFLALAVALILGRSCYRCYELSQGYRDSDLITDEGLFIALEGVLIYLSVLALCIGHPGYIFGHNSDVNRDSFGSSHSLQPVAVKPVSQTQQTPA